MKNEPRTIVAILNRVNLVAFDEHFNPLPLETLPAKYALPVIRHLMYERKKVQDAHLKKGLCD